MSLIEKHSIDYVSWARRANARWIVHHGLGKNAEAYLFHLESADKKRLHASCRNAYLMVWQRDCREDPKPWFYSGLFSLANQAEAEQFLADHWFTNEITLCNREPSALCPAGNELSPATVEKLQQLRNAIAKLPD